MAYAFKLRIREPFLGRTKAHRSNVRRDAHIRRTRMYLCTHTYTCAQQHTARRKKHVMKPGGMGDVNGPYVRRNLGY
eukprot:42188-Eustigmatos_ZCMA.PRE.1